MTDEDNLNNSESVSPETIDPIALAEAAKAAVSSIQSPSQSNVQDSVVSGDLHTGDVIHYTINIASDSGDVPNPTPAPTQVFGDPHAVILGNVQQQIGGASPYGQVLMVGPPSAAAKVMGIFIIIWGVIGTSYGSLSVFSQSHYGTIYTLLMVVGTVTGMGIIFAGVQVLNFQKKGIHLAWILIAVGMIANIVSMSMLPDLTIQMVEDGDMTQDEADLLNGAGGLVAGIGIGVSVICSAICGVLVAIPMMVANNGLDESSLFSKKKEEKSNLFLQ